ncbi:MAG: hypothetical protein J0I41_10280 [Filimonas sp.]|nr:hypothetical protein [Filimonas sp.]
MRYLPGLPFLLLFLFPAFSIAQSPKQIIPGKLYDHIPVRKSSGASYLLDLAKDRAYEIDVFQQGVAVGFTLSDTNQTILAQSKRPEDITGHLKRDFTPSYTGSYYLKISYYVDPENTDSGEISIHVKPLTDQEMAKRSRIKKELAPENSKNVQTIDIDHFWEAFDRLKGSRTFADSVAVFQQYYLDRATDGLLDFIEVRDLTAEKYVAQVKLYPRYFASIRKRTYEVEKVKPVIEEVFERFKTIYSNFKPFKVCFAMGILNTGGTVSNSFILIGTEVMASSPEADLSEFVKYNNTNKVNQLSARKNFEEEIRKIVAHECGHTQQKPGMADTAIQCKLLYQSIREGACDFVGELLVHGHINTAGNNYGDKHELQLWTAFKNELCNENIGNWLYNSDRVKNQPGDLGYYIGYKIVQSYYENAIDKKKAIADILEMTDPVDFLMKSKYDRKPKK